MSYFSKIATRIRHSRILEDMEWLWNALRRPYHFLLNFNNKGVTVKISEQLSIKIPPEYYKEGMADYERPSTEQIIKWIKANPYCYILDLGCSVGYISAVSLFTSDSAKVVGFDSDLSSLKASQKMCRYTPSKNFNFIYGLISNEDTTFVEIGEAIKHTTETLSLSSATGKPGTTSYVNLDTKIPHIPKYSIDSLYKNTEIQNAVLLKCDIEGAELYALQGASNFIDKYNPAILLSVHPVILPVFNCTVQGVRDFLKSKKYNIKTISIDHEEHWWCTVTPN